jgi:integrase
MDARHLPANWASTGNALEGLALAAKDALLVVDDFWPSGSSADVQRLHREADRLFRGQGNRAGRQGMRADATLRPPKPPRGLLLSTGEDTPRGQSLRARLLVQEISPGDFGPQPPDPNPMLSTATDRRRDRPELTADELRQVLTATRASELSFRGLSGPDRFHLDATACRTGFRASALASLTPESFDFADDTPTVTLAARHAKNRKKKVQPCPPTLPSCCASTGPTNRPGSLSGAERGQSTIAAPRCCGATLKAPTSPAPLWARTAPVR